MDPLAGIVLLEDFLLEKCYKNEKAFRKNKLHYPRNMNMMKVCFHSRRKERVEVYPFLIAPELA
jgi:hypothetical protein